ncbi:MAG TPA: ArsA family ATPase [Candidatus Binataceae bacterium]|nr:ArsA family ATPase [Candidatus Binataceae bacterium]
MRRRLIMVMGKGGVGRTTVCATLAEVARHRTLRTLVIEVDVHTPIARGYGVKTGFRPQPLTDNLFAMLLDRRESIEEYLGFVVARPILQAVFASNLYQNFIQAAPALRELMMMGKIFHEIERRAPALPPWDLVLVDLPASGQALAMLEMPLAARETFGDNLVGREAAAIARLFRDRDRCALLVATTAEPLAVAETLEVSRKLAAVGLPCQGVMLNRVSPPPFSTADLARLERSPGRLRCRPTLIAIARKALNRHERERRAAVMLRRLIGVPLLALAELPGRTNRELAAELARTLDPQASARADV